MSGLQPVYTKDLDSESLTAYLYSVGYSQGPCNAVRISRDTSEGRRWISTSQILDPLMVDRLSKVGITIADNEDPELSDGIVHCHMDSSHAMRIQMRRKFRCPSAGDIDILKNISTILQSVPYTPSNRRELFKCALREVFRRKGNHMALLRTQPDRDRFISTEVGMMFMERRLPHSPSRVLSREDVLSLSEIASEPHPATARIVGLARSLSTEAAVCRGLSNVIFGWAFRHDAARVDPSQVGI